MKFNLKTLRHLALDVLKISDSDSYSINMIYPRREKPPDMKIYLSCSLSITERFWIVSRAHRGKHFVSLEKECSIEFDVSPHFGTVCGLLRSEKVD